MACYRRSSLIHLFLLVFDWNLPDNDFIMAIPPTHDLGAGSRQGLARLFDLVASRPAGCLTKPPLHHGRRLAWVLFLEQYSTHHRHPSFLSSPLKRGAFLLAGSGRPLVVLLPLKEDEGGSGVGLGCFSLARLGISWSKPPFRNKIRVRNKEDTHSCLVRWLDVPKE